MVGASIEEMTVWSSSRNFWLWHTKSPVMTPRSGLAAVGKQENLGEVVDVGTGRGQMAIMLLESGVATRVIGTDWDEKKLEDARAASKDLPASYEKADVREFSPPPCDTLLLIDVLHY